MDWIKPYMNDRKRKARNLSVNEGEGDSNGEGTVR